MNKTQIEWVKNPDGSQGYTWNPITGCLNHINGMCKGGGFPCYAYRLANTRLRERYLGNDNIANPMRTGRRDDIEEEAIEILSDPFYPRFWPKRILPLHIPRRADSPKKGIFVCDMGELFGDWIPRSWQEQVFNTIKANSDYRFYLLTKQPQNLIKWSPSPDNCFVGVTATDYKMFSCALEYLKDIQAVVKYISIEPMLDRLNLPLLDEVLINCGINWLIIGAQTRPTVYPKIEWVEEIESACNKAGIAVFEKDNLNPLLDYNLRQEMPK